MMFSTLFAINFNILKLNDSQPPVPPSPPADLNLDCATDVPQPVDLTADDDVDGKITVSPTTQFYPGNCPNDFVMVRTWTFIDSEGNSSSVSQTISVIDTVAPAIQSPPADLALDCAADVPPPVKLTAIDNCQGEMTRSPTTQFYPGDCPNDFVMVRTWTFADTCGNVSSVRQTISVVDTVAPVIQSPPADLTLECDSEIPPPIDLVAMDNCHRDQVITPVEKIIPGICVNAYTIIRTWEAKDTCGNMAVYTQKIEIGDKTPPELVCPADETVSCNNIPSVDDAGYFATATDNCDGIPDVFYNGETREDFCNDGYYLLKRSWTAVDDCGNDASCEQVITVITNVETDCWIVRLNNAQYDENAGQTVYTWKLFGKTGHACRYALSYIKFELPTGEKAIDLRKNSKFVYPGNVSKYTVENPSSDKSKKTDIYGIKYSPVGEGISEGGPETFEYTLPGESILSKVNVEIKAGKNPQSADVNTECACSQKNLKSQGIISEVATFNENKFRVYPNPFNQILYFEFESDFSTSCKIEVYDITGRKIETVFNESVEKGISYQAKFIPATVKSSMYFYKITTDRNIHSGKVIYKE